MRYQVNDNYLQEKMSEVFAVFDVDPVLDNPTRIKVGLMGYVLGHVVTKVLTMVSDEMFEDWVEALRVSRSKSRQVQH